MFFFEPLQPSDLFWIGLLLLALAGAAMFLGKLDWLGALSGIGIGLWLYWHIRVGGLMLLATLFVLGTAASEWKKQEKIDLGLRQENEGKRSWQNVWGNAGAAVVWLLLGAVGFISDFWLPAAASLAAATADTLASEVGNVEGKVYFNISNFKLGKKGEDGSISFEGTLAALVGAMLAAAFFLLGFPERSMLLFSALVMAGFLGCQLDSVLGATLQKRKVLNNHTVNFFSTFMAGAICWALLYFFGK